MSAGSVTEAGYTSPATASAAVVVDALVKRYPKSPVNAVDAISFTVAPGEVFGLLGPNGAGKTTTYHGVPGAEAKTRADELLDQFGLRIRGRRSRGCPGFKW